MNNREKVLNVLDSMNINYELVEHQAVYTMEEGIALGIENTDEMVKNLFLNDDKKQRFFLVSISNKKNVNLKILREQLNSRALSFTSEERLKLILNLEKGAVTPLGIINDTENKVEVVFDEDIKKYNKVGVHPNDNTASVFLAPKDLEKIIKEQGNILSYIKFK